MNDNASMIPVFFSCEEKLNADALCGNAADPYYDYFPDMEQCAKQALDCCGWPARLNQLFQRSSQGHQIKVATLCSGSDGVIQCLEDC